jgi:hypothetical protein
MITNATTRRGNPATTSDQWHVVHSKWCGKRANHPPFAREIVSEHGKNKTAALAAARKLATRMASAMRERPAAERDEFLVRPPLFRSLKFTTNRAADRRPS